jgi:VanZ family protein
MGTRSDERSLPPKPRQQGSCYDPERRKRGKLRRGKANKKRATALRRSSVKHLFNPLKWPASLRVMIVIGLYGAVVVAALIPAAQPPADGGFDHYVHAIVFAGLTIVTFFALPILWIDAAIAFGISVLIEAAQLFVPERSGSLSDIAANALGVSIAVALILMWTWFRARTSKRPSPRR